MNQKSYLSKNGAVYLVICKDKSVADCFELNEIDGEDYAQTIQYIINMNTERTVDDEGSH